MAIESNQCDFLNAKYLFKLFSRTGCVCLSVPPALRYGRHLSLWGCQCLLSQHRPRPRPGPAAPFGALQAEQRLLVCAVSHHISPVTLVLCRIAGVSQRTFQRMPCPFEATEKRVNVISQFIAATNNFTGLPSPCPADINFNACPQFLSTVFCHGC